MFKGFLIIISIFIPYWVEAETKPRLFDGLNLSLHSHLTEIRQPLIVQFGLPIPPDINLNINDIAIFDDHQQLPIRIEVLSYWPSSFAKQKIRAVLISIQLPISERLPQHLLISTSLRRQIDPRLSLVQLSSHWPDVTKSWQAIPVSKEYLNSDGMLEPLVYVTLPAEWLSKSLLKTYTKPLLTDERMRWFDQYVELYGHTAVNDGPSGKLKAIDFNHTEPWMFDRVSNLYQLYFRTGDIKWLRHAHRAAQFYAQHINQRGYLQINKRCDLKCSYSQGLWLDYLITGDRRQLSVIKRIESAGKRWRPRYSRGLTFFTERHQTYAFWALLTAWEAFPEDFNRYLKVVNYFEQTYHGITQPPLDWQITGCYQHEYRDHEGEGGNEAICSPWMTALLAEVIWKYYLLTNDQRALTLLSGFGDYIVKIGSYRVTRNGRLNLVSTWLPWYIAGVDFHTLANPGNDQHHSCDVAGILARAAWAKNRLGLPNQLTQRRLDELLSTCQLDLSLGRKWVGKAITKKQLWPIAPFRKYNWIFGSTHDLSWLIDANNQLPHRIPKKTQ